MTSNAAVALRTLCCVLTLAFAATASLAQSNDEARFRDAYLRRSEAIRNVAADMLVVELRDRVEAIASRGSSVGVASTERRVRGFEESLLQGIQAALCRESTPSTARPSPVVLETIDAAAKGQHLRAEASDRGELAAITQTLLDKKPRAEWCALRSLDDIR